MLDKVLKILKFSFTYIDGYGNWYTRWLKVLYHQIDKAIVFVTVWYKKEPQGKRQFSQNQFFKAKV